MKFLRFFKCFFSCFLLVNTSFLKSPSPSTLSRLVGGESRRKGRRGAVCPATAEALLALQEGSAHDGEGSPREAVAVLRVDTSVVVEKSRDHLDSDSTGISGLSSPRGSGVEYGQLSEDLVVAMSSMGGGARADGLSFADEPVGSRMTAGVESMPSARLMARHCARDDDAVEASSVDGFGCVVGGDGSQSGARRTRVVGIDPMCKKLAWEGFVDPFKAGEESGVEAFDKLALSCAALFKCICDCDRKCGNHYYFDQTHFENFEDRQKLKLTKFWRSFQRAIIACLPEPLRVGIAHGTCRFKVISQKGDMACVSFVQQCDVRLSECSNPCFVSTNKANLLYWAACKLVFTICFFENSPIKKRFNYYEFGQRDGANKIYASIVPDLIEYCHEAIVRCKKNRLAADGVSVDPRAFAIFNYLNGFKVALERTAKLCDE